MSRPRRGEASNCRPTGTGTTMSLSIRAKTSRSPNEAQRRTLRWAAERPDWPALVPAPNVRNVLDSPIAPEGYGKGEVLWGVVDEGVSPPPLAPAGHLLLHQRGRFGIGELLRSIIGPGGAGERAIPMLCEAGVWTPSSSDTLSGSSAWVRMPRAPCTNGRTWSTVIPICTLSRSAFGLRSRSTRGTGSSRSPCPQ